MAEANSRPKSADGQGTSSRFFNDFVNGYLSKHPDARFLVKLKEDDGRRFLRFSDVDKITSIYCDYREVNGKVLDRNLKKRKDNFKNSIALFQKDGYPKKVGFGKELGKEYLEYEIKDKQMWQSLKRNYSVPRNSHTTRENFIASQDGPSSNTSGIVTTQSDDCFGNERKFRESLRPGEASSDTGDVSLSDDHLVDEPCWSLGKTDIVEASFNTGISDDLSKECLFGELILDDELDQYLGQKKGTSSRFFNDFVNGYLSKHPEARCLVKLKEDDGSSFLRFNDVDKITSIYCDYREENGKVLDRNLKKRKDNFKNSMALFEKYGYLKKVGFGMEFERKILKYEIKDEKMWQSLKRNYSVPRNSHTTRENFIASEDGPSSDTSGIVTTQSDDWFGNETRENFSVSEDEPSSDTSGLVTTQSDDCVGNERKFRESLQWPEEASSDTGDVSLSDDHFVDEPYFSLGETDKFEASFIKGICDELSKDIWFGELPSNDELDQYLLQKKVVNQMYPQKLTITPNFSYIEGGSTFSVHAVSELQSGIYQVSFGPYGICKASGDGTKWLQGMDEIPKAQRSGTHSVTVQVWDENRRHIGNFPFTYKDINADAVMQELASESPTSFGQWSPRNEPDRATKTFSGEPIDQEVPNKKMKSCPIDMPMLMYFCNEMAKRGDEDFFRALIGLGILADVLANPNEYFNSFAVTAREHGHGELAELIAMSSREPSYDSWMEKLTLGTLVDAVQTERSLANLVNSPDNDSSGYDGDCDSEVQDDAFCSDVGSDGDDDDDDGSCIRIIPREREINFEMAELDSLELAKSYEMFELEKEANYEILELEVEQVQVKSPDPFPWQVGIWYQKLVRLYRYC